MNYFTFDGIDSRTYNTYIATSNAFDAPGREDEVIKVPGSNNIYYLTEGTYKPFDIKLYCYIPSNMQVKTDDLRNFLLSKGTCRYTEAIRPNEFRVARFIEAYELDVSDRVSAAFVLTFKAQPQRYLTTNTPITTPATADTTTDTTMSLNTVPTPLNISLNGNTTQEGTPTPSTPQAIHNVSGDNEIKVVGKNIAIPESTTQTANGLSFTKLADGGWLVNGTATGTTFVVVGYTSVLPSGANYTLSGCPSGGSANTFRLQLTDYPIVTSIASDFGNGATFTSSGIQYRVRIRVNSGATLTNAIFKPQIELGSSRTTYEPYTEQSYSINLGTIELNKIGTYQDYIYKNGGKWYVHKETGKVDLGTLTWNLYTGGSNINVFYATGLTTLKINSSNTAYCTAYICQAWTALGTRTEDTLEIHPTLPYIYIADSSISTARDFQTAMNGVIFCYVLRTSTNTEITDTTLINQLNNIEKAYSYNGTTNILQVSNDNGFMLEVVSLHSNDVNSDYKGEPIITVNSTGLIYFNGCVIKVNQAPMTINSQTMQAYNGTVNLNNYIEADDFPMIEAGNNVIGSEMPLSIVPNYWKL